MRYTVFPNACKLVSYPGIGTTIKQSAGFTGTNSQMSKRGSLKLRRAAVQTPYSCIKSYGTTHGSRDSLGLDPRPTM